MEEKTNIGRKQHLYGWLAFAVVVFLSMIYSAAVNIKTYYWDCFYYWESADPVFADGFDLLKFPETFRGYFLPLLISFFKTFLPGFWGWRLPASLALGICFSFSLPVLYHGRPVESLKEFIRTLAAYACFMWFWGDFMQYPLSDFIAAFFIISGAACMIRARNVRNKAGVLYFLIAGAFLYVSYNTRAAFLYGVLFALLVFILTGRRNIKKTFFALLLILAGAVVTALPQCMINKQHVGRFSPKVFTEAYAEYSQDLQTLQVFFGMPVPKYEGFIGPGSEFPPGGMVFIDPSGNAIIDREQITRENFSLGVLFKLFLKYPLDMAAIYVRHLIALMTPCYRQVFITSVNRSVGPAVCISIFLWLLAGFDLALRIRKRISETALWAFAVCLPALLQLFGATELRFFLPVYILCYYYIFVIMDHKAFIAAYKGRWLFVIVFSLILFGLWITVFADILSNNTERVFLIGNGNLYGLIRSILK